MATLRRQWITLATAAITAAVLLGGGILVARLGSSGQSQSARTYAKTPQPGPAPAAAPAPATGPEGVPLTRGLPLGPARSPAPGRSSGGIPCGTQEQLRYHVHARLTLYVNGRQRSVPLGVGIAPPRKITKSDRGDFVSRGACFSFLHTHAADGVIHIEAPGRVGFKLGEFFAVWRQRLDKRHLGSTRGRVVAFVDGRRFHGDPRAIVLRKHTQVQLEVGQPIVSPKTISFPSTL